MREAALKRILDEHNVPKNIRDYINEVDGVPDDFDLDAEVQNHLNERAELAKAKLTPVIKKEVETELNDSIYAKVKASAINKVKKLADFTAEEIASFKDINDAIKLLHVKNQELVAAASSMGVEEWQGKVDAVNDKLEATMNKLNQVESSKEEEIRKAKESAELEKKNWKIDTKYKELIYNKEVIEFDKDASFYEDVMKMKIDKNGYKIDLNEDGKLVPKMKDGTRAVALNGNGFYDTAEQLFDAIASKDKFKKVSNGGEGNRSGTISSAESVINGVKIKRSQNKSWLATKLGEEVN